MNEDLNPSAPTDSLDADPEVQREGIGHVEADEPTYPVQSKDPLGQNGPSYEMNQVVRGKELHPGGSVSEHSNLSHADGDK